MSFCHCLAGKARTGSDFTLNATFAEEAVALSGDPRLFERDGEDGGHWMRHYFCGDCGRTLYHRVEQRPGAVSVAVS